MAHVLKVSREDPVIHLKAYGGVQITGVDQQEVTCEIDAPQLATLVEENGHVYVTVNAACELAVPVMASIVIERGMSSVLIKGVLNPINVEKVMGNLVLVEVGQVTVEKVGGNLSAWKTTGMIEADKVACNLTMDDVEAVSVNKVGGNCVLRDIRGDVRVDKAGGSCKVQGIAGLAILSKFGGSFKAQDVTLAQDVKTGGSIELNGCQFSDDLSLHAGGNVSIELSEAEPDLTFNIISGGHKIKIKAQDEDILIRQSQYEHTLGGGSVAIGIRAGGSVSVGDTPEPWDDFIGDLSGRFKFEESAFSTIIQERIESATRRAEAKVKTTEIRLGQIQDQVEMFRGITIDSGEEEDEHRATPHYPKQPMPPVTRPAGSKGATDEERLMILKMLEEGKITVDEAETLFKAMES